MQAGYLVYPSAVAYHHVEVMLLGGGDEALKSSRTQTVVAVDECDPLAACVGYAYVFGLRYADVAVKVHHAYSPTCPRVSLVAAQ